MGSMYRFVAAVALLFASGSLPASGQVASDSAPRYDHHVHLLSPQLLSDWKSLDAEFSRGDVDYTEVERIFESQKIDGAFLVSMAHLYSSPEMQFSVPEGADPKKLERERVVRENDFIARSVARYPDRAVGFFSVNPLSDYATDEMNRCFQRGLTGMKLHLPACGVDLREAVHVKKMQESFQWAARKHVPVLLHLFTPEPDGDVRALSRLFWKEVVGPCAELELHLAHLGAASGFNAASATVLEEFELYQQSNDAAEGQRVFFDLSGAILAEETDGIPPTSQESCQRLATYIKRIGLERFLFASDYPVFSKSATVDALRAGLGFPPEEFRTLLNNRSSVFERLEADRFLPSQDPIPVPVPADAIALLVDQGTNLFLGRNGGPVDWAIENGVATSTPNGQHANHIVSDIHFQDAEIHVEFLIPAETAGNSGIYLHGSYELQILNSWGKEAVTEQDVGSLYGFAAPLVNAARPPDEWQVLDIRYRATRRDETGKISEEGEVSAWLNGQLVQNKTRFGEPKSGFRPFIYRTTDYVRSLAEQYRKTQTGPLFLQDHGNPVQFRNVWIRPLDDKAFRNSDRRAKNLEYSVQELRDAVGDWTVETEFLTEDGSVARTVTGTCKFDWVVEDRLLSGTTTIPELQMALAIMFYVSEATQKIEMTSVGADGKLWVMTGEFGDDTRYTQEYDSDDGQKSQLRFTRFKVTENGFESKMEYTEDCGKSWKPGNHQVFRRAAGK